MVNGFTGKKRLIKLVYVINYLIFFIEIQPTEMKEEDVEFRKEFIIKMMPRLEWDALTKALNMVWMIAYG